MPAGSGVACGASETQISVPTSITWHQSIKCPGSPQHQTGSPRPPHQHPSDRKWVKRRTWREQREKEQMWLRRPADPAPLGMDLSPADSGARPPLQRGWARGRRFTQDLGRGTGLEVEWGERERGKRDRRPHFADPLARHHLVLSQLNSQVQRRRVMALDPLRGLLREPHKWIAPAQGDRWYGRRCFPQPTAICGMSPGAVEPSQRAGRFFFLNRWQCCSGFRPTRWRMAICASP